MTAQTHNALAGELAFWLWRCGGLHGLPSGLTGPFVHQIRHGWSAAARRWQERGCPYEAAQAMLDGDEPALRQALATFEALGARPLAALAEDRLHRPAATSRAGWHGPCAPRP